MAWSYVTGAGGGNAPFLFVFALGGKAELPMRPVTSR
jgi:hypothetical protein